MGSNDIAPPGVPAWVVPLSTAFLGLGVVLWGAMHVMMTRRNLKTQSYSTPLLALALNVSWEIVYGVYVTKQPLERAGFAVWLLLDIGPVYTTIAFGAESGGPIRGLRAGWAGSSPA